ncbi:MAG: MMPL family transporter [Candidatus Heimdallarchaeota archaeon]|nr:MMPL family transporter [Candidatus Heimdallarchaeota archaeon]
MVGFDDLLKFVMKRKKSIIVFWFFIAILMISLFTPNLIGRLTDDIPPPEGTTADEGNTLLSTYFPEVDTSQGHVIVLESINENSILSSELKLFTQSLQGFAQTNYADELIKFAGYYIFDQTELDPFKGQFVSSDNTTSFITLYFNGDGDFQAEVAEDLREFVTELSPDYDEIFDSYTTGLAALRMDLKENAEADLKRIDVIVIPLVFLALIIILRNWRYFPITITPILMSIAITLGILERVVALTDMTLQSFVPSILFSITLGVGVDYNLFLLTRFREERLNEKSVVESVGKMIHYAGHTVFTSGLTLTITLLGMAFFPFIAISGVGFAIGISIAVLLAINLTLTPSLLLIFGHWVEKSPKETQEIEPEDDFDGDESDTKTAHTKGIFYTIGKFATKRKYSLIFVILLLTLPLSLQLLETTPESEMAFLAPRDSDAGTGFLLLNDKFGSGVLSPLQLVIIPDSGDVWSSAVFDDFQRFINQIIETTIIGPEAFFSHAFLGGAPVPYAVALNFTDSSSLSFNSQQATIYRSMTSQFVSSSDGIEGDAAIIQIILPVEPSSPEARDLLHDIEDIAEDEFGTYYIVGYTGLTANDDSSISRTYELFPLIVLLVIIAIYALIGFMFKAVMLPARLIFTIALTISFIYGAATVVFQYDTFLNDLFPVLDGVSVIFWIIPVMTFSIILGLGMDYDIFTIERIKENVWNGMENDEAIAQGIAKTGSIITGAGVIMMISFGGLIFSSSYMLMQFGFILAFAVFLDTFVVRTLLVPSIMSMAEKANWWPSSPPKN